MKDTAKEVAKKINIQVLDEEFEEKLLEPDLNVNLGTKYLSILKIRLWLLLNSNIT